MSNRILRVQVHNRSLDPPQVELWLSAETEHVAATTELRGRLTGAAMSLRCHRGSGVPAAAVPPAAGRGERPGGGRRHPGAKLVGSGGSIRLPGDGGIVGGRRSLRSGSGSAQPAPRSAGAARPAQHDGKGLLLRGRALTGCDESEAAALRRAGCNLLLAQAEADLWDLADLCGFFVLGRLSEPSEAAWSGRSVCPIILPVSAGCWSRCSSAGRASRSADSAMPAPRSACKSRSRRRNRRPKGLVLLPVRLRPPLTGASSACRCCFSAMDRIHPTRLAP